MSWSLRTVRALTGLRVAKRTFSLVHTPISRLALLSSTRVIAPSVFFGPTKTFPQISPFQKRFYAEKVVNTPQFADSITEGELARWEVKVGQNVKRDQLLAVVETDKVDIEINCPDDGVIVELYASPGDTIQTGSKLYKLDVGAVSKTAPAEEPKKAESAPKKEEPKKVEPAPKVTEAKKEEPKKAAPKKEEVPKAEASAPTSAGSGDTRVKMSRLRLRIAERLKESQDTAASLTTFNEIDLRPISELRDSYKEAFLKKHGVKLGFMSAFVKAASVALQDVPEVNASIDGTDIIYHDYTDISVAVSTPKGLVTPVLRGVEKMSYAQIEKELAALSVKARDCKITIEDMAGGTFTISNGGVFGSLMGTPIINMPQSAILGMHAIKDRPVAVNGQVVIRPMMYVALTYDHRLIDGREAVTFLVRVKELVEDPRRLLLGL